MTIDFKNGFMFSFDKCVSCLVGFLFVAIFICSNSGLEARVLDFSEFQVRGFEGRGPLEFNSPEGIVVSSDGRIVVADSDNNRLQLLDSDGNFLRFIPDLPENVQTDTQQGRAAIKNLQQLQKILVQPTGLHLGEDNRLYVACRGSHLIAVINLNNGRLIDTIGTPGSGQGNLGGPMDVAVNRDGRIAVAEWNNRRVQILSESGECLKELIYQEERPGRAPSAVAPRSVHWTFDGNLIVTYPLFNQVVSWSPESGDVVWRYGIQGTDPGMLDNPSFVIDGPDGYYLISDTRNNRIVQITRNGKYFNNYHIRRGTAPGRLISPRGLALTRQQNLVIADQGNNRVHFFLPGRITLMLRDIQELIIADKWEEALNLIERVLHLQPNNQEAQEYMVNALYYFGDKAFENEDYSRAEEYYRRVLRFRPGDPRVAEKLDAIFWAANMGLITRIVFGIIAIVIILIIIWMIKIIIYRFISTD